MMLEEGEINCAEFVWCISVINLSREKVNLGKLRFRRCNKLVATCVIYVESAEKFREFSL